MGPDDANDVSKALAAIGADSIGYQRFTQTPIRPQSAVRARPDAAASQALPAAHDGAHFIPSEVPLRPKPAAMPPVPAFRRTIDPAVTVRRPQPMPPPRPLVDGSVPVGLVAVRPVGDPQHPAGQSVMAASSRPSSALSSVPVAPIPATALEARAVDTADRVHHESLAAVFAMLAHGPDAADEVLSPSK